MTDKKYQVADRKNNKFVCVSKLSKMSFGILLLCSILATTPSYAGGCFSKGAYCCSDDLDTPPNSPRRSSPKGWGRSILAYGGAAGAMRANAQGSVESTNDVYHRMADVAVDVAVSVVKPAVKKLLKNSTGQVGHPRQCPNTKTKAKQRKNNVSLQPSRKDTDDEKENA